MIEFEKGDIETLDFMVATMVQKKSVNGQDLIDEGYIKTESSEGFEFNVRADDRRADEFVRYLSILDKYEVCDCFYGEDSEFGRKNENTLRFHLGGGFKALYSELTSQEKQKMLENRKIEVDLELAQKMLKEYPKTKWFARIGFIIGIVLVILEVIKFFIRSES